MAWCRKLEVRDSTLEAQGSDTLDEADDSWV
jgi:hypothetical protein